MDSRASDDRRPILCLVTDRSACREPLPEAVEAAVAIYPPPSRYIGGAAHRILSMRIRQ